MAHSTCSQQSRPQVAVIGGGPAGLMAAEIIAQAGFSAAVYDAMPSPGRKFLLAGVGGMNITHSEAHSTLLTRYAGAQFQLQPHLDNFSASHICEWIHGLGIETFVGSSGRVFPADMKAAPLLRAWLHRLRELGVQIYPRHKWVGWQDDKLVFQTGAELADQKIIHADAVVLALGGASWPRLGSDGSWVALLREKNINVNNLVPSNCGFEMGWSEQFKQHFSGTPLQTINLRVIDLQGNEHCLRGEAMIVATGIEGTGVYALSAILRDKLAAEGYAELRVDLLPDKTQAQIVAHLSKPRGKNSYSNFLRKQLHLPPVKLALLRELTSAETWQDPTALAAAIKALPLRLTAHRPIAEAISCAGGIAFDELDKNLMLKKIPGIFCAGEMLDWEAPTGGYLLTACFATGRAAGAGLVNYLKDYASL